MVSRNCHPRAVANVDCKLCRSRKDGHRVGRKLESSSSVAKIVRIGAGKRKMFSSRPEKETSGLSFFVLKGKIEQRIQISARARSRGPGLWKELRRALTASVESCDKHLKTPQKR